MYRTATSTFKLREDSVAALVGINEDLSFYEGAGEGPDVAKVKDAVKRL